MAPVRILIADDHTLFRQGLREICANKGGFDVVGEAVNGREAVEMARALLPDVILMDIRMPELDGVQATRELSLAQLPCKVIILTTYPQDSYVFDAIRAGAMGYLLKDVDWQELINSINTVAEGKALLNPALAARVLEEFRRIGRQPSGERVKENLSPAEMDVLILVAYGKENQEIARELFLSEKTVANRLSEIYRKLQVNTRTQAALVALRRGWAHLEEIQ